MTCDIRHVSYSGILEADSSAQLIAEYSAECSIPEIGTPNPQKALYDRMESSGFMDCLGVFDHNVLVGFATILFYVLPHYGKKIASVESLFVAQSHRRNGTGSQLMQSIEQAATANGCVIVLYSAPTGGQLERVLGARKNCRRTNSVFTRNLQ